MSFYKPDTVTVLDNGLFELKKKVFGRDYTIAVTDMVASKELIEQFFKNAVTHERELREGK